MEKQEKRRIITIIVLSTFILVSVIIYMLTADKLFKPKNVKVKEYESIAIVKEGPSSEKQALMDMITEKYKELGYMDQENIETFEILDIVEYGYYQSMPEIKYYQVNFNYTCKDKTENCITYKGDYGNTKDKNIGYKSAVFVALNNGEFVKFQKGESHKPDSGFIETLDIIK